MFPVAQGFDGNAETFGEGGLAGAGSCVEGADVNCGVGASLGFVLGDVTGDVLFGRGVELGPV